MGLAPFLHSARTGLPGHVHLALIRLLDSRLPLPAQFTKASAIVEVSGRNVD